jgi:hypothetical protein
MKTDLYTILQQSEIFFLTFYFQNVYHYRRKSMDFFIVDFSQHIEVKVLVIF